MLADIIQGIIVGIYNVIEEILNLSKSKETVEQHIVKNDLIYERLNSLLKEMKASRIYIRQYHNGGYYYTGMPMQKFSCTYEAVADGIAPEFSILQNNLVSETPLLHTEIINKKHCYIADVEQLENTSYRQKLASRGIKACYARGIWNIDGALIGLLCVDYVNIGHTMTTEEQVKLEDFAKHVSGYISKVPEKSKTKTITIIFVALFILLSLTELMVTTSYIVKGIALLLPHLFH